MQGELNAALKALFGKPLSAQGAARTDAGVHAEGQTASLRAPRLFRGDIRAALNARLPEDVSVISAETAPASFHARNDARRKTYRYRFWNRASRPALERERAYWLAAPLNLTAMRRRAKDLLGRRDFSGYAGRASRLLPKTCRVESITVKKSGGLVAVDITADRFLHNMVRRIAGDLAQAGLGRARRPLTLPAHGLTLLNVSYK